MANKCLLGPSQIKISFRASIFTALAGYAVVRRLMPFTALKLVYLFCHIIKINCCAPPNAVYGIETCNTGYGVFTLQLTVVRRLMPFAALKLYSSGITVNNGIELRTA